MPVFFLLPIGNHKHQNSLDFSSEGWPEGRTDHRNKLQDGRHNRRSVAHSLVGTPNYIAPEVLLQAGMFLCVTDQHKVHYNIKYNSENE